MARKIKNSTPVNRKASKGFIHGKIKSSDLYRILSFDVDPLILLKTGGIHVYPGQQISISIVFEEGVVEISDFLCQYIRQSQGGKEGIAHFVRVEGEKEYKLCAEIRLYEKEIRGRNIKRGILPARRSNG